MKRAIILTFCLVFPQVASAQENETDRPAPQQEDRDDTIAPAEGTAAGTAEPVIDPMADRSPEPLPERSLNTRLSGHWRSEILLSGRGHIEYLDNGRYGIRTSDGKVFPFYNTITLSAREVGTQGLSIHFQGWVGVDLADVYFAERVVADPTYFYIQYQNLGLNVKAGRQMVFSGAARGLRLDGAVLAYQAPFHLGLEALGGLLVSRRYGPDWYRGETANQFSKFGAGFSDWEREGAWGDYAYGGRLFYRLAGRVSAGVSFLQTLRYGEFDQRLAGIDLDLVPFRYGALTGNAIFDIADLGLQEASAGLDLYPIDRVSLALDYRHTDPTRYLSRLSIFSVFSSEQYDTVGGTIRVIPLQGLSLHAGYHHHFYGFFDTAEASDTTGGEDQVSRETGYDIACGARFSWGKTQRLVMLDYRRIRQDQSGMNQLRAGAIIPLPMPDLRATANIYLDVYDEETNEQRIGFLGDIGLNWRSGQWEVGGAFTAGLTPYAAHELKGLAKLGYDFDWRFSQRRHP